MRGTANRSGIQYKREVTATMAIPFDDGGGGGGEPPSATGPCDSLPGTGASRVALLQWLDDAGVTIEDASSLTKRELWSFVNDFCD